ncbi:hypothetical protein [Microbacterium gorillae]|uniref:hypothetical protein n=1 Tax=Microbacterium gorillae TaxID=1231063 RepID=UPI003D98425E
MSDGEIRAAAVLWPGAGQDGAWRGVIDETHERMSALGPVTTGERRWRCFHKHQTEAAATRCAQRQLRAKPMGGAE